ncbi:cytosine methyltransferase [Thiomicrospira sp. S5]|nr:cytosine methyltransferase [Thiomicrospira sp. S5]
MGFRNVGFDSVWHNEFNPAYLTGFKYGMNSLYGLTENELNIKQGSITNISYSEIKRNTPNNLLRNGNFGVIGGPPCPDFSNGGKHKGSEGENGKLTGIYIDVILELKPEFFVLENVKGLIQKTKHRNYLFSLMKKVSKDYYFDLNLLNALEFGVPQDRERVFFIGFRKDSLMEKKGVTFCQHIQALNNISLTSNFSTKALSTRLNWFDWPVDSRFVGAKTLFEWPNLSPYGKTPKLSSTLPERLTVGASVFNESINNLPNQDDTFRAFSEKFHQIKEGDVSRKSFKRLHRWRYSPTAAYGNNEVHLHPWLPRRLSVREVMRIQSVPDEYSLPFDMTLTDKFKTISNGVPVILAERIAEQVASFLKSNSYEIPENVNTELLTKVC